MSKFKVGDKVKYYGRPNEIWRIIQIPFFIKSNICIGKIDESYEKQWVSAKDLTLIKEYNNSLYEFKIGEKVKVKGKCGVWTIKYFDPRKDKYNEEMEFLVQQQEIDRIVNYKDLIPIEKEDNNMFKKEDLKVGMVVEINGFDEIVNSNNLYVATISSRGNIVFVNKSGWCDLRAYDQNLVSKVDSHIDKVYSQSKREIHQIDTDLESRTLIWERKNEKKEMTIAEIEKELGYEVKIVKE